MTLFSMFSPTQKRDKELLLTVVDMIEALIKLEEMDMVEEWGEIYLKLQTKIKHHDYSNEDAIERRHEQFFSN